MRIIENIELRSVLYPTEELKVLSEDEDVYVIYCLTSRDCEKYKVEEHNRYRIRPLKWWIRNYSDEDLERFANSINLGFLTLIRFKSKLSP